MTHDSFKIPDIESSIDPLAYSSDLPECSTPLVTMSYSPVTVTTTIQSLPVIQQPIVSANQIMEMNYAIQSVTSPFHSSPAAIPASHSANNLSQLSHLISHFRSNSSHLLSKFVQDVVVAINVDQMENTLFLLLINIYV